MCIICNCDKDDRACGSKFLEEFASMQTYLKRSETALLECAKIDGRYKSKHKQLVRLRKELNRWFSEERENHAEYKPRTNEKTTSI